MVFIAVFDGFAAENSINPTVEEDGVKFGVNTFVWVSPCTTEAVTELAPKVKGLGFDIFEISFENPELIDVKQVKKDLRNNALSPIVCGAFGPDRNICSEDPQIV